MSTNENKIQPQSVDIAKEEQKDEKKAECSDNKAANSDNKPEYKGNNPGGKSAAK